jgi:hypothetical protein
MMDSWVKAIRHADATGDCSKIARLLREMLEKRCGPIPPFSPNILRILLTAATPAWAEAIRHAQSTGDTSKLTTLLRAGNPTTVADLALLMHVFENYDLVTPPMTASRHRSSRS